MNKADTLELIGLIRRVDSCGKATAQNRIANLSDMQRGALLHDYRRRSIEKQGQLPIVGIEKPKKPASVPSGGKKVPYTLLLPPELLDEYKALSVAEGESVSSLIRRSMRQFLKAGSGQRR